MISEAESIDALLTSNLSTPDTGASSLQQLANELDKQIAGLPDWVRALFNKRVQIARAIEFKTLAALQLE
jgi:hypothetical protein